ncbi:hypothetical protein [Streptomyces litchfieldiae]|uniref:DUF3592 domain-containing protein n=1 Tax=Streptomyces litchfieldiae TaxID=3075543 RepID=A0ABU2MWZ6_9ACTN|nr:hypothetical protein [Streptomyces sp. DSM 44938]MDT0345897.1 hypothetical protein [Streptomyces sp. DSM 44938]
MRRMRRFFLLCVGVTSLLACWLVAFVVLFGLLVRAFGLWVLIGIPLVPALLMLAAWLILPFVDEVEPDGGPLLYVLAGSGCVAVAALWVAGVTADLAGAQVYHARFGEQTTAVVSWVDPVRNEYGNVTETWYYVVDPTTEEHLGVLAQEPANGTAEGDRVEVSVDPRGWMPPVPVDRLGWTTVPTAILVCCFAAVVLAALAVVAMALVTWVARVTPRHGTGSL